MRLKQPLYFCLGFILVLLCSAAKAADPILNGLSIHSELGKEQFIGALFSTAPSNDAVALVSSSSSLRMELKILAPEGMTTRRFSRTWIEGMAINNTQAALTDQAEYMVKFDGLFKGRFLLNDDIVFSYAQTKGVNIYVNDVLLGNIASEKFFSMLLSTWVGRVPLSSDFKEGVLKAGNVNAEMKSRFDKIKFTKERATEIVAWGKAKTPAEIAAEKEAAKSANSAQSSSVETIKVSKAELAKAEAAKIEAARLAAQRAEEEEKQPALTAQTLLARQFYVSDLLRKIRSNTRYPKRALEKNQAGSMRIAVVISRKGDIISTSLISASQYGLLNDAAQDAIAKSAPFPPMPDTIPGATFEFTAPTTFTLPK